MTWYVTPLDSRDDAYGVQMWIWADHEGLHCDSAPPKGKVPTGHLWGWGAGVRVHVREDAVAPTRGLLASLTPGGAEATVLDAGEDGFPKAVEAGGRFLRCATEADQKRFDALTLSVLLVTAPTSAVLIGDA